MHEPSKEVQARRKAFHMAASIIALITFAVYLPALKNGFVNWDDHLYITENLIIRKIDLHFFKFVFTSVVNSNWHPLTIVSYAIDYSIWGLDPMGYHLINIILHSLDTFLAGVLAFRLVETKAPLTPSNTLFGANRMAFIAGVVASLLFGLHPVHVESVAWVSERKDVLSAFFFILAILAYLEYSDPKAPKKALYYPLTLVFFILALLSKPMAVTLPVVLLILDYYPLERFSDQNGIKRLVLEKVPFFLISLLSALATIWAQASSGAVMTFENYPVSMRVLITVKGFIFYLYKMLLPLSLSPCYPPPLKADLLTFEFVISLAALICITLFCVLTIKRSKIFSAAWLYYIVTLLPVVGIIQVGGQAAADRYTYLPSLSPFILAGAGAAYLFEKFSKKPLPIILALSIIVTSSALGAKTISQQAVWKDSLTLWSEAIRQYPMSVPLIYNNRGLAYNKLGDYQKAIEDFDTALKINPSFFYTYVNRGIVYGKVGKFNEAIADFDSALRLKPDYGEAYYYRAIADFNLNAIDNAIYDLTQAIKFSQGYVDAYNKRGQAYIAVGNYALAIEDFRTALSLDPENGALYYNLGAASSKAGDTAGAEASFKRARELGYR